MLAQFVQSPIIPLAQDVAADLNEVLRPLGLLVFGLRGGDELVLRVDDPGRVPRDDAARAIIAALNQPPASQHRGLFTSVTYN